MAPMRRWLLLFLVLLVPLRGGMGLAMAGELPRQHAAVAVEASATPAASHDCDGHHGAGSQAEEQAAASEPDGCATCASCQACSSVVLLTPDFQGDVPDLPGSLPILGEADYTDPAPTPARKPPRA